MANKKYHQPTQEEMREEYYSYSKHLRDIWFAEGEDKWDEFFANQEK